MHFKSVRHALAWAYGVEATLTTRGYASHWANMGGGSRTAIRGSPSHEHIAEAASIVRRAKARLSPEQGDLLDAIHLSDARPTLAARRIEAHTHYAEYLGRLVAREPAFIKEVMLEWTTLPRYRGAQVAKVDRQEWAGKLGVSRRTIDRWMLALCKEFDRREVALFGMLEPHFSDYVGEE